MLPTASDDTKSFAKSFYKYSNLEDSGISLPDFASKTYLKLHNISVTLKMIKRIIINIDFPKASAPNCISVVALMDSEPEFSYTLPELFNMCLKEFCFPVCWKVSSVVSAFKNVGKKSTGKNYHPVSVLTVVRTGLLIT